MPISRAWRRDPYEMRTNKLSRQGRQLLRRIRHSDGGSLTPNAPSRQERDQRGNGTRAIESARLKRNSQRFSGLVFWRGFFQVVTMGLFDKAGSGLLPVTAQGRKV